MKIRKITISDQTGVLLFQGEIGELPLKEEYILEKSMELFHEKDPCIIYRTHISKKFCLELMDAIERLRKVDLPCSEIAESLRGTDLCLENASLHITEW